MRFLDYNGSGGLDPQDIATSVGLEEAAQANGDETEPEPQRLSSNAGCAAALACMALPIAIILLAL